MRRSRSLSGLLAHSWSFSFPGAHTGGGPGASGYLTVGRCQRPHQSVESLAGIVRLELDLQAPLSAIEEYACFGQGGFLDGRRNAFLLRKGTDSANMVAGQALRVGWTHHSCSLALKGAGQLFHADFPVRRHDDADRLAVDLGHQGLQDAPRLHTHTLSSLQADTLCFRIIVVAMEGEFYTELVQKSGGTRAR